MDITAFNLSNPWRSGRDWVVPVIERSILGKIIQWIDEPEILVLTGARQVGKTSILYQLIDRLMSTWKADPLDIYFFNLDITGIEDFLDNPGTFLRFINAEGPKRKYIFIDEVQRLDDPGIFVKAIQDMRLPLKLFLTGSSSLDIRAKTQETLTGRKQVFQVDTLSFREYLRTLSGFPELPDLDPENYHIYLNALNEALHDYGIYGGYPAVALTDDISKKALKLGEILSSYLEKDIAGFLKVDNISAFRKMATLLASQQGGLVNLQELASTLGIHRDTVSSYLYYLEQTFVVDRVTPFFSNQRTELSKMPKLYFADPGLRNTAMGNFSDLDSRSDKGQIIEGIVASHLFNNVYPASKVNFWRTKSGAEVDFVVSYGKRINSIEVKDTIVNRVGISRGYRSFLVKYAPERSLLLNRNLWKQKEIEKKIVEAMPVSIFLLQD